MLLRDRPAILRDRLLASPRFQRWAARFPLTRPIARQRAQALFDICGGFVYSQVLFACVRLDVCGALAGEPRGLDELAARFGLSVENAACLLNAAASLGLVRYRANARYGLGPLGAALVGNPGIGAMVEHHARLYADLADPVALLRGGVGRTALSEYWPYARAQDPAALKPTDVADYSGLMAASLPLIADEALDACSLRGQRCLLDVGGGEGVFLERAGARWKDLKLMLFDLPAVVERARQRLGDRATCVGGDFRLDELPRGADIVSLVRVLHDHDDDTVRALLAAVRRALPAGGRVLVAEPMAGTRRAEPAAAAYFGFYLLAMGSGRPRSPQVLSKMIEQAGFRRVRLLRTAQPMLTRAITAEL